MTGRRGGRRPVRRFLLDRVVPGYPGRPRVPTGARDQREHDACRALFSRLLGDHRTDLVDAVMQRQVTLAHLVRLERAGRLGWALADLRLTGNLWAAVDAHFPPAPGRVMNSTSARYRRSMLRLRRVAGLGDDATVRTLATVDWRALRAAWGASASDWMHLRRAVSRLLTLVLRSKRHPFRDEVLFEFPTATVRPREPSHELAAVLAAQMPDVVRAVVAVLALLGLRPGEFFRCRPADWCPATGRLTVPGTKTDAAARVIEVHPDDLPVLGPLLASVLPPPCAPGTFNRWWREARKAAGLERLQLRDLRHVALGAWLEQGATLPAAQAAAGHESASMTLWYARRRLGRLPRLTQGA